jgi:hypothetical protein
VVLCSQPSMQGAPGSIPSTGEREATRRRDKRERGGDEREGRWERESWVGCPSVWVAQVTRMGLH